MFESTDFAHRRECLEGVLGDGVERLLAQLADVHEGGVEVPELGLGDGACAGPVDDVEEDFGVVLQPHGEVVESARLAHQRAPHVDPLVDRHAGLGLGLGLV